MKKQWACSGCGFACSWTTWQSFLKPTNAVICNACRSKKKSAEDEGPKHNLPESSIVRENVGFTMGKIGMIFGNLTFEPTLAIPLILGAKSSLSPKVIKSELVTANDNNCVRTDHFYPSTTSTFPLGNTTIQIKQEYESEETGSVVEAVWDSNAVKKKKRSKLPQYTLSPLARFINHLQRASTHRRRLRCLSAGGPKYDDVLIYQKCLYVAENEIGLGAELIPPTGYERRRSVVIKEEPSSTYI